MINVKYQGDSPTKGREYDAGYDVRSSDDVTIYPNSCGQVITTTRLQPPMDTFYTAIPRSGLCNKNGLILINSVGVIDPTYTGATVWNFWNLSDKPVDIGKGERIGQFVFHKRLDVNFINEPFEETERGANGFGSSGVM